MFHLGMCLDTAKSGLTCATFLGNDGNDIHGRYPLREFMSLLINE